MIRKQKSLCHCTRDSIIIVLCCIVLCCGRFKLEGALQDSLAFCLSPLVQREKITYKKSKRSATVPEDLSPSYKLGLSAMKVVKEAMMCVAMWREEQTFRSLEKVHACDKNTRIISRCIDRGRIQLSF